MESGLNRRINGEGTRSEDKWRVSGKNRRINGECTELENKWRVN